MYRVQVHGLSLFDNLEGLTFYHVMKVARSDHVRKAAVVELIQVLVCMGRCMRDIRKVISF